ncbi:MAG: YeeE/YedE thiosulfate transporter family protein, partial [Nocardioidaceae bacterium]
MIVALAAGAAAGAALGYVLQRSDLCFHSMFAGALEGRTRLLQGWLLGVALAALGLTALFASPWSTGLNTGLAFRPVSNVAGGLLIGVGMVVARSCLSGLFYKLGAGMLGALVGLAGWAGGELAAGLLPTLGPTLLAGGTAGT